MTPEQRLLLRRAILMTLAEASASIGLPLRGTIGLSHTIVMARPDLKTVIDEPNALEGEIVYLSDKGFVTDVNRELSPEIKHYRITAIGRDYLAAQGLA